MALPPPRLSRPLVVTRLVQSSFVLSILHFRFRFRLSSNFLHVASDLCGWAICIGGHQKTSKAAFTKQTFIRSINHFQYSRYSSFYLSKVARSLSLLSCLSLCSSKVLTSHSRLVFDSSAAIRFLFAFSGVRRL